MNRPCKDCHRPLGFWAKSVKGHKAPLERPPEGVKANIVIKTINGETFYEVVKPGDGEFVVHATTCAKVRAA